MRFVLLLLPVIGVGCDDTIFLPHTAPAPIGGEGFCAVQDLIAAQCLTCHSAAAHLGDLDLETDPHGALVDQPSTQWPGEVLVVAGDPDASLLQQKLEDIQMSGDPMPPTGIPDEATAAAIREWISAGADDVCDAGPGDTGTTARTHPPGWSAPLEHGLSTKLQTYTDCRTCHGATLDGDLGPSCDTCHQGGGDGWRTTCTFCHGGTESEGGAPPRDIDGTDDPAAISFPPHTAHVAGQWHDPFACTTCHDEPADALSVGHLFDDATPAVAEVDLSDGLSSTGTWSAGSCSDVYCHGDGQVTGSVSVADAPLSCDSCHPATSDFQSMSGDHGYHLSKGETCSGCHEDTVDASMQIVGLALHVNGMPDVVLPGTMQRNGNTCTGFCHGEGHDEDW